MLIFCPFVSFAGDTSETVGFYVSANLPDNQKDNGVSYFDLRMRRGQKQDIITTVYNENAEEIKVKVEVISASTNANGIIDYKTPDIKDETLKTPLSEIADIKTQELVIPGEKSAKAVVSIEMPEEEYDGTILGSIVFTKINEDTEAWNENLKETQQGVYINNEFSYVIGVKLTETDVAIPPAFEGVEAKPELLNYRVHVVHYIRNKEAAIAKNVQLEIKVYSQKEQTIVKTAKESVDMAPNSVMPYALMWDGEISPGKYVSHVSMKLDEDEWSFDLPFEVGAQVVQEINNESMEQSQSIPWWTLLLIVIFAVFTLIFLLLLIAVKRRKKEEEKREAGQRMTRSKRRR